MGEILQQFPAMPAATVEWDANLLSLLACPACHGSLSIENARLHCTGCHCTYSIAGIPALIAERAEPAAEPGETVVAAVES
jgi:uncharacterized protein YbaR (Trm112 family)